MNTVYVVLVRVCTGSCFAGLTLLSQHTSREMVESSKELHPMTLSRLLSFYYFMDQCNATFTEHYAFHKVLCVKYSIHYLSFWLMSLANNKKSLNAENN